MNGGDLAALLPFMEIRSRLTGTRGVSLPFTDECAPILPGGMGFEEAARPVIDWAGGRGWRTLEIRGRGRVMGNIPPAFDYLSHTLDLTEGEEVLFSRYSRTVRRNIRKSEREGVSVGSDRTPAGVREFYRLNCLTRRDHGLPPQPALFFENLREHVLEKGLGTLLLARYGGKAIAGAVFLHFGTRAVYKYGASDRRYLHLRPNNLVFREAIRSMCGKGCRTFSFGRTDIGHDGLRRFKLAWGTKETHLQYIRFDLNSKKWLSPGKSSPRPWEGVFSRMPLSVLRLVGSIAYRHVG